MIIASGITIGLCINLIRKDCSYNLCIFLINSFRVAGSLSSTDLTANLKSSGFSIEWTSVKASPCKFVGKIEKTPKGRFNGTGEPNRGAVVSQSYNP